MQPQKKCSRWKILLIKPQMRKMEQWVFQQELHIPSRTSKRGPRHRASAGPPACGRQGDQRRPGAQGARRSRRRHRSRRRSGRTENRGTADRRGDPERLRPDRGRVAYDDRGRRPDELELHRDQRVGAARPPRGARAVRREAALSLAAPPGSSCSPGSLPREVPADFYAEAVRDLARPPGSLGPRLRRRGAPRPASRPSRSS